MNIENYLLSFITNIDFYRSLEHYTTLHCVIGVYIGRFSAPYFPAFELNKGKYGVYLRTQSKRLKIRSMKKLRMRTLFAQYLMSMFSQFFLKKCKMLCASNVAVKRFLSKFNVSYKLIQHSSTKAFFSKNFNFK